MGEIEEFVTLYIKDSDILENEALKISNDLENNIKDVIAPGKVGYDTGHLHDSIVSNYEVDGDTAWITGWYSADYGQYWYRWKGGVDFLSEGCKQTIENYR